MSELKTRTEIGAGETWVQVLEQLKSGSLSGGDGVNRLFERLAENDDTLFAALSSLANGFLTGGGSWSFSSTTFAWSSAFQVRWPGTRGAVHSNAVNAGNIGMPDAGGVAYVVLNRTTDGATVAVAYAASMSALRAIMAATTARADYFLLAYRSGSHVILSDGRRVLDGYSLTGDGSTDTQYAQTSAFTAVKNRQTQNHNLRLVGGGNLSWAVALGTGTFTWSSDLSLLISGQATAGGDQHADYQVTADDIDLDEGEVAYLNLGDRDPGTGGVGSGPTLSLQVAAYDSFTPTADQLIVAYHHSDGRLYLCNGQSIGDGDTVILGAASVGLQWYLGEAGADEQAWDLTVGGTYPDRIYPVGTHALLVFRNGVKQKASDAYWDGTYPTGSLVGTIAAEDDYLEEDAGEGDGSRILWLRDTDTPDTDENTTKVYRTWETPVGGVTSGEDHDPPHTWPSAGTFIEAFIGIHGQGPSPVEGVRIEGEGPEDDLDGIVVFRAGAGIVLSYEDGTLKIEVDSGAPVTSIDGGAGPQGGALTLAAGAGLALDDTTTPGTLEFALDAGLGDLDGVSSDLAAALLGPYTPSATNPVLSRRTVTALQGFDLVWSPGGTKVRAAGGVLNEGASTTRHDSTALASYLEADAVTHTVGGGLVVGSWVYVYVKHVDLGNPNARPKLWFSMTPPDRSVQFGRYPGDTSYVFLTSAYYDGTGYLYPFTKNRCRVTLGRELDVSAAFAGAVGTLSGLYAWRATTPAPLPVTRGALARFRLRVTAVDPVNGRGNLFPLYIRPTGASGYRKHISVMAAKLLEPGSAAVDNTVIEFEFEAQLDGVGAFDISLPDVLYTGAPQVWLTGYDEPVASAADSAMGV